MIGNLLLLSPWTGVALSVAEKNAILLQVPLLEWLTIDLHNGILEQGLCSHQLVACGIVNNVQDTNLLGAVLGTPGEVTLKSEIKVGGVRSKMSIPNPT